MEMVVLLPMYYILYDIKRTVKRDPSRRTRGTRDAAGSSAGRLKRRAVQYRRLDEPRGHVVDGQTPGVLHVFPPFVGRWTRHGLK